jgi:competence protein ComGF
MLKITHDPNLIINEIDLSTINEKLHEFHIETVSKFNCHDKEGFITLHIYGEDDDINKLIYWLDNEYNDIAEIEL